VVKPTFWVQIFTQLKSCLMPFRGVYQTRPIKTLSRMPIAFVVLDCTERENSADLDLCTSWQETHTDLTLVVLSRLSLAVLRTFQMLVYWDILLHSARTFFC
jgi:hypothetical protein